MVEPFSSTLADGQEQTTDDTIALLHMVHDWPGFSNHRDSAGSVTSSLETIHDQIHVEVGGNGQMSDPSVAGWSILIILNPFFNTFVP
jgi:tyrosinase